MLIHLHPDSVQATPGGLELITLLCASLGDSLSRAGCGMLQTSPGFSRGASLVFSQGQPLRTWATLAMPPSRACIIHSWSWLEALEFSGGGEATDPLHNCSNASGGLSIAKALYLCQHKAEFSSVSVKWNREFLQVYNQKRKLGPKIRLYTDRSTIMVPLHNPLPVQPLSLYTPCYRKVLIKQHTCNSHFLKWEQAVADSGWVKLINQLSKTWDKQLVGDNIKIGRLNRSRRNKIIQCRVEKLKSLETKPCTEKPLSIS